MNHRRLTRLRRIDETSREWMRRHGILLLRISLGIVFFWFGLLKFFPDLSPAETLVQKTVEVLTFGLVTPSVGIHAVATLECLVGLGLLLGARLRAVLLLLGLQMIGAMSPIFLFPEQVFVRVPFVPTLEGQYILKNIVLISAAIVIGATLGNPPEEEVPDVLDE